MLIFGRNANFYRIFKLYIEFTIYKLNINQNDMISNHPSEPTIKELKIFQDFIVDKSLPKYKDNYIDGFTPSVSFNTTPTIANFINPVGFNDKISLKKRVAKYLLNIIEGKGNKNIKPKNVMSISAFFNTVTLSYYELSKIGDISLYYERALNKATSMGQVALVEKLKDAIDIVRSEACLIDLGITRYLTEQQIIDFYEKTDKDKNLQLTWVKNFTRLIPDEIYNAKIKADMLNVFDNYVVLHYDPFKISAKMTKAEIEKAKDPILFGVIKNSKKLYYVGDWIDDYCDLTLEDVLKKIDGEAADITYDTVKTYIDKINSVNVENDDH